MAVKSPQEMVELYQNAEAELLEGKTIIFQGRQISHESLDMIRKGRQEWEKRAAAVASGGRSSGPSLVEFC